MIKKIILILIISLSFKNQIFASNINIVLKVDDEIITNHDIEKEINYLKFTNPTLVSLEERKIKEIAQKNLIDEIIKDKESKKANIKKNINNRINEITKQLYTKTNYTSEDEFISALQLNKTYNIDEIKNKIEIQLLWNNLIYERFGNLVEIDQDKLKRNIDKSSKKINKEYLLSEIVFKKKSGKSLQNLINEITQSINEIGFENTALLYSISETSKTGGKLEWLSESSLSIKIYEQLREMKVGEYSKVIKIGNNYLILKINDLKVRNIKIDEKKELEFLIQNEFNRKLNQFSRIYFEKIKLNYNINE